MYYRGLLLGALCALTSLAAVSTRAAPDQPGSATPNSLPPGQRAGHLPIALDLGEARRFNGFFRQGFTAPSSDVQGRLAAGGDMSINHYSIADRLSAADLGASLVVGGDLDFPSGRVYAGDILVAGSAAGVGDPVINGLSDDQQLVENAQLPLDFEHEFGLLEDISALLSGLQANGTAVSQWGGLYLEGDCTSPAQVFDLDGAEVLNAHTFDVSCVPDGATIIFNISGSNPGLTNMSLESLSDHNRATLFNFYEATSLALAGIGVHGSILAPFADIDQPQGVVYGTVMANSWDGPMQLNHDPFQGVGAGDFCAMYPIALPDDVLSTSQPGDEILELPRGTGPGNYSWLTWTGSPSTPTLANSLVPPGDSYTYVNPDDDTDWLLSSGDWVRGAPGAKNGKAVRDNLDALLGAEIAVPAWEVTRGQGNNFDHRVAQFAKIRLLDYRLPGHGWLSFEFLGYTNCYNRPPIAHGASFSTEEQSPVDVILSASDPDSDTLSFHIVQDPTSGSLAGDPPLLEYMPDDGFEGTDSFQFTARDEFLESPPATITIQVTKANTAPIAQAQAYQIEQGTSFDFELIGTDADGDALDFMVLSSPTGGNLTGDVPNLTYTADKNFVGTDSFEYSVSDGIDNSLPAVITIKVSEKNHPPTAHPQLLEVGFSSSAALHLTGTDPDGDELSFQITQAPQNGNLSGQPPALTYTPSVDFVGVDELKFIASDGKSASNPATIHIEVIAPQPPQIISTPGPTAVLSEAYLYQPVWAPDDIDPVTFTLIESPEGMTQDSGSGLIAWTPNQAGTFSVVWSITDRLGRSDQQSFSVQVNSENTLDAPSPELGIQDRLIDLEGFLYLDDDPVQRNANTDSFDPERFAVIRGRVTDEAGAPLPGVLIRALNRPDFGYTLSREDGEFDLAVNGGGRITLDYSISARLPVQRTVVVPRHDYVYAPEVSLVKLNSKVTQVDLSHQSSGIQIARGSVETDADGSRQATVLFEPGTVAEFTATDGTPISIQQFGFRATEYTVGERGPYMMPGDLPANVAYTYAVELSIDEALQAGAETVHFSNPVVFYVENFLQFPTGTGVPVGYYDRTLAEWIGSQNGAVIEIVDIVGGEAVLDVSGDSPAGGDLLQELGISNSELKQLAELYSVGQTIQRVELSHFSPWDLNYPIGPDEDTDAPSRPDGESDAADEVPDQEKEECEGCIITAADRSVAKVVSLPGVPFDLRYDSRRQRGYKRSRRLIVPVTGSEVDDQLIRAEVIISVAGQQIRREFPPLPNQEWVFDWNGLDIRGRQIPLAKAKVKVSYIYPMWYGIPASWQQDTPLWGAPPPGMAINDRTRFSYGETSRSTSWDRLLGVGPLPEAAALGGWTASVQNATLAASSDKSMYLQRGDGITSNSELGQRTVDTVAEAADGLMWPIGLASSSDGTVYVADSDANRIFKVLSSGQVEPFAGTGTSLSSGDGGAATAAGLNSPSDVAIDSNGFVYIAEEGASKVRRVAPDGTIATIAGTGEWGYTGDGGPAIDASLHCPYRLAVDSSDSIYVADQCNQTVRKIDVNGIIQTIAGTGERGFSGDGGLAKDAQLKNPKGIAITPNGNLYISDFSNNRIRKVQTDGLISTVAGTGDWGDGSAGPATQTQISWPDGLASAGDESLLFVEFSNLYDDGLIRELSDSKIQTIAGTTEADFIRDPDDGVLARHATFDLLYDIAAGPNGAIYVTETANARVRRISVPPSMKIPSDLGLGEFQAVPSKNGNELFFFDNKGRHIETRDTLNLTLLFKFAYDENNQLIRVEDSHGNITSIERSEQDNEILIKSPYGQEYTLVLNENGYTREIRSPLQEPETYHYTDDGLIASYVDQRGKKTQEFSYTPDGELQSDVMPDGASWSLNRESTDMSSTTSMETAEGRTFSFGVSVFPNGDRMHVNSNPSGHTTTTLFERAKGLSTTTYPDDSFISRQSVPHPRFGMYSPITTQEIVGLPSGRTWELNRDRIETLTDESDPFSLMSVSETVDINGRIYRSQYDTQSREWRMTTPGSRETTIDVDSFGRPASAKHSGLAPIEYRYDERGRVESITSQHGDAKRGVLFEYHASGDQAGYLATVRDFNAQVTRFEYDGAGRVSKQMNNDESVIEFEYDNSGRLTKLTPPSGPHYTFEYYSSGLRQKYSATAPDDVNFSTTYQFNSDRQVTDITRPGGESILFSYDSGGRLSSVTSDAGQVTYSHHPETGRLTSIDAPGQVGLDYKYDGFLITEESWTGPVTGAVSKDFDNNLWLIAETAAGHRVDYDYDLDGLLLQVGEIALTRHSEHGLLASTHHGGVEGFREYSGFGELRERSVTISDSPIYRAVYDRDGSGKVVGSTVEIGGVSTRTSYAYDSRGRLKSVEENGVVTYSYEYDNNGNRVHEVSNANLVEASYDDHGRLIAYGETEFSYDPSGDLASKIDVAGKTTYDYDAAGNLRSVVLPDGTRVNYIADGRNRRVGKAVNGSVRSTWIYRDNLNPVAQYDSEGNLIRRFVYAERANSPSYMVAYDPLNGTEDTFRLIADPRGSIRLVVNVETGEVVQRLDYGPFGKILLDTNPGFQPFGFAGGLYDSDTGLVKFGARDYDPKTGRWTSKDPIDFAGGDPNLYAYALSDPINLADLTGFQPDLNLTPVTQRDLYRWALTFDGDPERFTVVCHGNSINGCYTPYETPLGSERFKQRLLDHGWNGQQPIEILGCDVGKGGSSSPAQEYSDELGVDVFAPTEKFWATGEGIVAPKGPDGRPVMSRQGRIQKFSPRGNAP